MYPSANLGLLKYFKEMLHIDTDRNTNSEDHQLVANVFGFDTVSHPQLHSCQEGLLS